MTCNLPLDRNGQRRRPLRRELLLAAALTLGGWACGDTQRLERPAGSEDWSVVVVALDAMPARVLGCYGYERDTTPRIDAFAATGVRFESAWASASYTLASTASLFTGLEPGVHGVLGLRTNVLPAGHGTLAEAFRAAGFATAGFSGNPHITAEGGFDQGFERFEYYRPPMRPHRVTPQMLADGLDWWRANAGRRRFLCVHLLPPHQPYDPPPPHDIRFGADRSERREGDTDYLLELDEQAPLDPNDPRVARVRDRYDAGMNYADSVFGELLDELDGSGARENTLVVLLSDHGEAFAEHGRLLHGSTVFREMCQVPLVMRWPGCTPGTRIDLTRTRDLAASLAHLCALEWRTSGIAGSSFLEQILNPGVRQERAVLTRSDGTTPIWALRQGRWTLIYHRSSDHTLLIDRGVDPDEMHDIADQLPAQLERMSEELRLRLDRAQQLRTRSDLRPGQASSREETLRDLGYTGED